MRRPEPGEEGAALIPILIPIAAFECVFGQSSELSTGLQPNKIKAFGFQLTPTILHGDVCCGDQGVYLGMSGGVSPVRHAARRKKRGMIPPGRPIHSRPVPARETNGAFRHGRGWSGAIGNARLRPRRGPSPGRRPTTGRASRRKLFTAVEDIERLLQNFRPDMSGEAV
ncbi:hypothetical protein D3C81_760190 [compost metagenome]